VIGRYLLRILAAQYGWARPFGDFNVRWISAIFRPIRPIGPIRLFRPAYGSQTVRTYLAARRTGELSGGQAQRVMVTFPALGSHMGNDQLCAHAPDRAPQQRLVADDLGVGQHNVQVQIGSMKREDLKVVLGRKSLGLSRGHHEVQRQDASGRRIDERVTDSGDQ